MFLFRSWNIGPPFSTRHDRWFRHFVLYRCASNGSFFQLTKSICGATRWADDGIRSGSLWRTNILKYSRFKGSSRRRCQSIQWPRDIWRIFTIFICAFKLKRYKLKVNLLSICTSLCFLNAWQTFDGNVLYIFDDHYESYVFSSIWLYWTDHIVKVKMVFPTYCSFLFHR